VSATPQAQPRSPLEAGARVPARPAARPRSAWALAAVAWRLYGRRPIPFLLPIALVELPLLTLTTGALAVLDPGPTAITADWILRFTVFTLADSLLTLNEAVFDFLLLAIIAVQVAAHLDGRALSLRGALRAVLPRLGALLGGSFLLVVSVGMLTMLGIFLSVVFSLVLAVLNADPNSGGLEGAIRAGLANPTQDLWLRLFFLAAVAAASIFLVVKWSLMVQVVVLEDSAPLKALHRSWVLVRGAFWRTLGLLLVGMLPLTLLSNGTLVAQFFGLAPTSPERVAILAAARAGGLFVRMLLLPWALTLLTLYYYDLRLRREGAPA
jgi:hypothetical protein